MSILIANTGNRIVGTIAERNAITKKFPGMTVSVMDSTADPQTSSGWAKYEWLDDGINPRWGLVTIDEKPNVTFTTEEHILVNGKVTLDNIPLDATILSGKIIDVVNGQYLREVVMPVITIAEIDISSLDFDGHTLQVTYAYGAFSAQLDSVFADLKDKVFNLTADTITLDDGAIFTKTVTANTVFSVVSTEVTGNVEGFILELTNGGAFTIDWFTGIAWEGGTAPSLTAAGLDLLAFYTHDAGLTWRGTVMALDTKQVV